MRSFDEIFAIAADRKGGAEALNAMLEPPLPVADLLKISDDRWLGTMAKQIFCAGFNWKVIEAKWDGFEAAFKGFDLGKCAMMDDVWFDELVQDTRIVRHGGKIQAVRDNAAFLQELAQEHGSVAQAIASWAGSDYIGLLAMLKVRGTRLGGTTGQYVLRFLGVDGFILSRDVVARLIYGFRISVLFGLILTLISSVIGVAAGAVQGYFGGWTDLIFQRVIEVWTSVPSLYLLIIIAAVIEPNFWILLGILLLFSWVALVGVVRAEFLRGRNFEYVRAARALGVSDRVIMFKHLLPNAMVATLTFMPFILNGSITTLTSLDFLGFGLPPGSPSLGELLSQGKNNLQAPWLGISGFMVIATMLSLLIFVGEAVRDALDPRKTFV